ncbi:MAG TPA: ABC transporter ATP-binding protein [Bacillota bacterium]|jgi:ABC-type multidrug transport system ATPase subunit
MGVLPAYQLSRLTKIYKSRVVANNNISLEIKCGEILGVFGPNGAGKTTMVRQMMGLLRPTSGQILLFAKDVVARPERVPETVAYFSQKVMSLNPFSFKEVLVHAGVHRGMSSSNARKQAARLVEFFDCGHCTDRYLYQLSGGERKLSLLLSTFMGHKKILILDEPTNEIDPLRRARVWSYLLERNRDDGVTVILVTHNVVEAEAVVDRVVIIDRGIVRGIGTPGELKANLDVMSHVVFTLKPHVKVSAAPFDVTHIHGQTWSAMATTQDVARLFSQLVDVLGMQSLDDFRVSTPSLEDVYMQLTGRSFANGQAGSE